MCDALKRLVPCHAHHPPSPTPQQRPGAPGPGWLRLGGARARASGPLDHHLEPTWKRRAGFSLRQGSEGRGRDLNCSGPARQRSGWPHCAKRAMLPPPGLHPRACVTAHEGQAWREGPGTGSCGMYCPGPNHGWAWQPGGGKAPWGGRGEGGCCCPAGMGFRGSERCHAAAGPMLPCSPIWVTSSLRRLPRWEEQRLDQAILGGSLSGLAHTRRQAGGPQGPGAWMGHTHCVAWHVT